MFSDKLAQLDLNFCGGLFRIQSSDDGRDFTLEDAYYPFTDVRSKAGSSFSVRAKAESGYLEAPSTDYIFNSNIFWKVYRENAGYRFETVPHVKPVNEGRLDRVIKCSADFLSIHLTCDPELIPTPFPYPFFGGMDRLLLASVLPYHQFGFLEHSCGILDDNHGFLFVGCRGRGKSTLAKIWQKTTEATVVSDECCGICRNGTGWVLHGTPWPSKAMCYANRSGPLKMIFFLEHAPVNECIPLTSGRVFSALFPQAVLPVWDAKAMTHLMDIIDQLSRDIPGVLLRFRPDHEVIESIRNCL